MTVIKGFDFYSLTFDASGKLALGNEFSGFEQGAAAATDAILIAHGFRNDVQDATNLYTNFLGTFRDHLSEAEFKEVSTRKFIVGGVFWPSKALPESFSKGEGGTQALGDEPAQAVTSITQQLVDLRDAVPERAAQLNEALTLIPSLENDPAAQDRFASLVLSTLDGNELDPTEGLQTVTQQSGSAIFSQLQSPIILPSAPPDEDEADGAGGVASFDPEFDTESVGSFFGGILGGIDKFVNLTTWYLMKNRSGVVGETGMAQAVRDIKKGKPGLKIHLVGHSLGGRLMAACAKSLGQPPMLQPDSMTLLEAAFSHYGFSANNGHGQAGFFRDVIAKGVIKGPLLETFSFQDTVVGFAYAVTSRLAGDNTKAIGDADDEFGGIGRNGAQKTVESSFEKLKVASAPNGGYKFRTGIVTCLDGSGGLIKDHSDVTNPDVTYAFASAVAATANVGAASGGSS